jgi:mitochondrial protein MBA1
MLTACCFITGTFVAGPLRLVAKSPREFLLYQWLRVQARFKDFWGFFAMKISSMPRFSARPKYKIQRKTIIPSAVALHLRMSEAMAAGDKTALQEVCVYNLGQRLIRTLDRRNPAERVSWEVIEYNQPFWYPRIMSHKIAQFSPELAIQQAVVAISSTQKLARHDKKTGDVVPKSSKVQMLTEYVVISRQVPTGTWAPGPWKLFGNMSWTTLEGWKEEQAFTSAEEARSAERYSQ